MAEKKRLEDILVPQLNMVCYYAGVVDRLLESLKEAGTLEEEVIDRIKEEAREATYERSRRLVGLEKGEEKEITVEDVERGEYEVESSYEVSEDTE